jgi:hypothetical protein
MQVNMILRRKKQGAQVIPAPLTKQNKNKNKNDTMKIKENENFEDYYYRRARAYVNQYSCAMFGIGLNDLADTADIAGLADYIADTLADWNIRENKLSKSQAQEIAQVLRSEFTLQDLADNILG